MDQQEQQLAWLTFIVKTDVGGLLSSREPPWEPRGNQEGENRALGVARECFRLGSRLGSRRIRSTA